MSSNTVTYTDSMSLKVAELLKEVQLDYSPSFTKNVDDIVSSIKQVVCKIPKGFQVTSDLALGFVRDIKADKVEFKFKMPKFFEISGNYSMQCVAKPDVNVDAFVRIPKEMFYKPHRCITVVYWRTYFLKIMQDLLEEHFRGGRS